MRASRSHGGFTMQNPIFGPVIAQVALTTVVWVRMYFARIGEMRRRGINPQSISTSQKATGVLEDTTPADNFRNLFEVPVLFYVICLALVITGGVTPLQLGLAWAYVALRALHSFIHITYNRVVHRFASYVISTLVVLAMWLLFAVQWFCGG